MASVKKSRQAQQFKTYEVMDVNPSAVQSALSNVDLLVHGHTHRANIHDVDGKKRIVLGDWKEDSAQILEINANDHLQNLVLKKWQY